MDSNSLSLIQQLVSHLTDLHTLHPTLSSSDLVLRLRKIFPGAPIPLITAAVETFEARKVAPEKLGSWAQQGFFTTSLLEQASRVSIATYRARYFAGRAHVLEVGTGTGSDTSALAKVCGQVTTIEADPARCELAQHNLAVQGITNVTFLMGNALDVLTSLNLCQFDALFADPARRTADGTRLRDAQDYSPPLPSLLDLAVGTLRAIKVSPGLFFDAPKHGWSRQFLGFEDQCLEQTLWFGAPIPDSSVYLADDEIGWHPSGKVDTQAEPANLKGFLVEAHATINRSQYLAEFFQERSISLIAPDVAYGVSVTQPENSPFMTSFRIIEAFPFNLKALRTSLRSLAWTSRTEIKKRNFPGDPEELRAELKLPQHKHDAPFGTIFLFKWRGKTWVVLAKRAS